MVVRNLFLTLGLVLLLTSCTSLQKDIKSIAQTSKASNIKDDYLIIQNLLKDFKTKLDKRNPTQFNKNHQRNIYSLFKSQNKSFYIRYDNLVLKNYKEYLQLAFDKNDINNRNDFLVLGLYYLLYYGYNIEEGHKVTALQYDKERLSKAHKNLQIIRWKLKSTKDLNDKYLFLTWQNNWQIELEKKVLNGEKLSFEEIQKLKFIKEQRESLFDPSNFSFEVILSKMIHRVENSLKAMGQEPKELSISAIRGMFLFL